MNPNIHTENIASFKKNRSPKIEIGLSGQVVRSHPVPKIVYGLGNCFLNHTLILHCGLLS